MPGPVTDGDRAGVHFRGSEKRVLTRRELFDFTRFPLIDIAEGRPALQGLLAGLTDGRDGRLSRVLHFSEGPARSSSPSTAVVGRTFADMHWDRYLPRTWSDRPRTGGDQGNLMKKGPHRSTAQKPRGPTEDKLGRIGSARQSWDAPEMFVRRHLIREYE